MALEDGTEHISFTTEFAVELHCEACVETCKRAISQQKGVESYDISLKDQRITVTGKVPPSQLARALKKDGRQVIVKGTGTMDADNNGTEAAVCIFESFTPAQALAPGAQQDVHGIARMVQVGRTTLLDLTMRHDNLASKAQASGSSSFDVQMTMSTSTNGSSSSPPSIPANSLPAGYGVYIAQSGDTSQGAASTGGVLRELGQIELRRKDGYGDLFAELKDLNIWEVIGRAMVIAPLEANTNAKAEAMKMGPGILAGVIARSAGAWTNDKTVCTCSGKTQWQEAAAAKI